jgi:tRNA pseudouridine55 synthase
MDGVLNIHKPAGWTSHDVVQKARRILRESRIGHTGTLDPLATGVLVLCVGKATRIAQYLEAQEKEYRAVMRLGVMTDTLDADGKVIETKTYTPPSRDDILRVMQSFTGPILQQPPAYSALKVVGVPSYKLARKGKTVELKPRPVAVHHLELTSYDDPFVGLAVSCSKGLYVRTLCADIGAALGMGAHLVSLVRTRSGRFTLEQALSLDQLSALSAAGTLEKAFISIDKALSDFPLVEVGVSEAQRLSHGNQVPWSGNAEEDRIVRIHDPDGSLLAVGRAGGGKLRPELVFS